MTPRGPFQPLPFCDSVIIIPESQNNVAICAVEYWHLFLTAPNISLIYPFISVYFTCAVTKKHTMSAFSRQRMREKGETQFLQESGTQNGFS